MTAAGPYPALADGMRILLQRLGSPLVNDFLSSWPARHDTARPEPPAGVPVLRCVDGLAVAAAPVATQFITLLAAVSGELAWRRSYAAPAVDAVFLDRYGYCPILGPEAPVRSPGLAAGVLLLGPHVTYPAHWHEAEEVYVPLSGRAAWWQGVQPWTTRVPPEVIHHDRYEPHAMRTGASAMLALYLWRSADLAQTARLIARPPG